MSECVVRMELRKNCLDCDLHLIMYGGSYADTDVYCFKEKRFVGKRFGPIEDLARPSWCPIICQLPEGHGRLIDKDEVIESIRTEVTELFFNGLKGTPRPDGDLRFMWNRLEDEDFAPTVVPAERSE